MLIYLTYGVWALFAIWFVISCIAFVMFTKDAYENQDEVRLEDVLGNIALATLPLSVMLLLANFQVRDGSLWNRVIWRKTELND